MTTKRTEDLQQDYNNDPPMHPVEKLTIFSIVGMLAWIVLRLLGVV